MQGGRVADRWREAMAGGCLRVARRGCWRGESAAAVAGDGAAAADGGEGGEDRATRDDRGGEWGRAAGCHAAGSRPASPALAPVNRWGKHTEGESEGTALRTQAASRRKAIDLAMAWHERGE